MKTLLILSAIVGVTLSAIAYSPQTGKYCQYQKQLINVGEKYYPPGECLEISCEGSNGRARNAIYTSCPSTPMTDSPHEVIVERRELQYPECCPTLASVPNNEEAESNNEVSWY